MSNSFYGGRDGRPMIIKKAFKTISDMTTAFSNINYSEVGFGEYVIIESENKNNPENGRIFRRDKDFNSDRKINYWTKSETTNIFEEQEIFANGAVYVSQIVGPSGNAPHLTFVESLKEVRKIYSDYEGFVREQIVSDEKLITKLRLEIRQKLFADGSVNNETEEEVIEKAIDDLIDDKIKEVVNERITSLGAVGDAYDIKIASGERSASVAKQNLVPGKDGDKFNDEIKWLSCSVRDENQQKTDAYIGFEIPYTVIEWEAQSESPYYNRSDATYDESGELIEGAETNNFINQNLITRHKDDENAEHPFYQKWQIHIPKGIHGQSIKSIEVIPANEKIVKLTYNEDEEKTLARDENGKLITAPYADTEAMNDDIQNTRSVIVCNFMDYDRVPKGEPYTVYLGDYNMINEVTLEDNGNFIIQYSHNDNFERKDKDALNWLTDLDLTDGYIKVITNNNNLTNIQQQLNWPINININKDNGEVIYTDVEKENGTNKTYTQDPLTWVKNADITTNGKFQTITTTGNNQADTQLHWIENVNINPENGIITYQDVSINENGDKNTTTQQLHWVKEINIDEEDGTVNVIDVSGDSNKNVSYEKLLTWIKNISITNGKIDIETNNDKAELHQQLHWIEDINIDPESGLITYTDADTTTSTDQLTWVRSITFDKENGTVKVKYTTNKEDDVYENLIDWIKSISIAQNGMVSVVSNNGTNLLDVNQQKLKWIDKIDLADNGQFSYGYNTDDTAKNFSTQIKWPTNIEVDSNSGKITTTFNNGEKEQGPTMDWIKSATLDSNKNLKIDYVNSTDIEVPLKTPNKIELENGVIYVTYNTSSDRVSLGRVEGQVSACTAAIEAEVDPNLNDGGIWFVTEEEDE